MLFALVEIHTKICFQHQNIKSFVPNTEKGFMFKRKFIIITNSFLHLQIWIHLLCRQTDPKNASSTAKFVNRWRKFARSFYIFSRVLNNTFFLRRINRFYGFIGLQRFLLVFIFILTHVRTSRFRRVPKLGIPKLWNWNVEIFVSRGVSSLLCLSGRLFW